LVKKKDINKLKMILAQNIKNLWKIIFVEIDLNHLGDLIVYIIKLLNF
jgi:hypothetical protein